MSDKAAEHVGPIQAQPLAGQRLDKWLWFVRIVKSRTLAAQLVHDGKVRINRVKAAKSSQMVRPGDVLTVAIRGRIEVIKVLAPGVRRGPPTEARQLYELLSTSADAVSTTSAPALHQRGTGRPTKKRRRQIDRLMEQEG